MRQHHVLVFIVLGIFTLVGIAYGVVTRYMPEDIMFSSETQVGPEDVIVVEPEILPQEQVFVASKTDIDNQVVSIIESKQEPTSSGSVEDMPKPVQTHVPSQPLTKTYTSTEVAQHASKESCWTIIRGGVYDVTPFITKHPGGEKNILKICGKDGTSFFEGKHGGESRPENTLSTFSIGVLIQN